MCLLRGKMTGASVSFLEEQEKNEKDGDFSCSYFWVEKPRFEFPFSDILWSVIWTVGLLGPSDSRLA